LCRACAASGPTIRGSARHRLAIDLLEDRLAPAVLTVTTLLDNIAGSLRAEVFLAKDGDVVQFDASLSGQITLTTGEIDVTQSITINGPGSDVIAVSGNHNGRVFNVASNHNVAMTGLTIRDGQLTGQGKGAGILVAGTLSLRNCVLTNNSTSSAYAAEGGAMYVTGRLSLNHSTVSNNSAYDGGGIYYTTTAVERIRNSTIAHNTAVDDGGGIYHGLTGTGSTLIADGMLLSGNSASSGGGIWNNHKAIITNSTLSNNNALGSTAIGGGAVLNFYSALNITSSVITGNSATGNSKGGGGIYNQQGVLTVDSSTIANNSTLKSGGGLLNFGTATFVNDTLAQNSGANGGGVYNTDGFGYGNGFKLIVDSSTIAGNTTSGKGGGIDNVLVANITTVTMTNVIVAQNAASTGNDISGPIVPTSDHNLVGDGNGSSGLIDGVNGNQVGFYQTIDPKLGPLQNNGGLTPTMALLVGSPALDAGNNTGAPVWDQRGAGYPRIVNGTIDIGAFEVQDTTGPAGAPRVLVTAPLPVPASVGLPQPVPKHPSHVQPPADPAPAALAARTRVSSARGTNAALPRIAGYDIGADPLDWGWF
jgi:hypothetical protein